MDVSSRFASGPARLGLLVALLLPLPACTSPPSGIEPRGFPEDALPIDLERYMGDWFVVAHIPTSPEAEAYEAVESYALREDGSIDVLFRFCEGGLDGPPEEITMRGWVHDPTTNAEWRVRPFWPLRLRYQILELDPEYSRTVVVHPSGDYAWIMARSPDLLDEASIQAAIDRLAERSFDVERFRRVPHADGSCRGDA